jgi:hypothetical protein
MYLSALVEFKIHDGCATEIAEVFARKLLFAVHARQLHHFTLFQFNGALFVKASIRGTKVDDSLASPLFNPELDAWFPVKEEGVIHQRFSTVRTLYL